MRTRRNLSSEDWKNLAIIGAAALLIGSFIPSRPGGPSVTEYFLNSIGSHILAFLGGAGAMWEAIRRGKFPGPPGPTTPPPPTAADGEKKEKSEKKKEEVQKIANTDVNQIYQLCSGDPACEAYISTWIDKALNSPNPIDKNEAIHRIYQYFLTSFGIKPFDEPILAAVYGTASQVFPGVSNTVAEKAAPIVSSWEKQGAKVESVPVLPWLKGLNVPSPQWNLMTSVLGLPILILNTLSKPTALPQVKKSVDEALNLALNQGSGTIVWAGLVGGVPAVEVRGEDYHIIIGDLMSDLESLYPGISETAYQWQQSAPNPRNWPDFLQWYAGMSGQYDVLKWSGITPVDFLRNALQYSR
jgi:hypothetical protein